jgi:hypothetical protein
VTATPAITDVAVTIADVGCEHQRHPSFEDQSGSSNWWYLSGEPRPRMDRRAKHWLQLVLFHPKSMPPLRLLR